MKIAYIKSKKLEEARVLAGKKRELTFDENEPGRPTSSDDTAVQEMRKKRKKTRTGRRTSMYN